MKHLRLALTACFVVGGIVASSAMAGSELKLKARLFTFDPDNLGHVDAQWETHQGLPDAGKSDHALFLVKDALTTEFSAAGAEIEGAEGLTLTNDTNPFELGFDIRDDSHFTGGSPRFNVLATDGFHFIGGLSGVVGSTVYKGHTWFRVRFDAQNPVQAFPPVTPGAQVIFIDLVVDEGVDVPTANAGQYILDNIAVDPLESVEVRIGKPGNNKAGDN